MIRIISGIYKGRVIPTLKSADYRPSTSKLREALFSILTSGYFSDSNIINNADILDLFAGTGSIGFEGLSRGAQSVTFVDIKEEYLKMAKAFAEKIGVQQRTAYLKASAINLPYTSRKFDLVFMDPPYQKNLITKTIKSLVSEVWLKDQALIAVELDKLEQFEVPPNIKLINERRYGNNKLMIMKYEQS